MEIKVSENEKRCIELCRESALKMEREKGGNGGGIDSRLKDCISMCSVQSDE